MQGSDPDIPIQAASEQVDPTSVNLAETALSTSAAGSPSSNSVSDVAMVIVVCAVLLLTFTILLLNLYNTQANYSRGIDRAFQAPDVDNAAVIAYLRAADFAQTKTSTLFLAFTLIFVGALYVLRRSAVAYQLAVEGSIKGALQTSSPGLVMITLGVSLTALVFLRQSSVDYKVQPPVSRNVAPVSTTPIVEEEDSIEPPKPSEDSIELPKPSRHRLRRPVTVVPEEAITPKPSMSTSTTGAMTRPLEGGNSGQASGN